MKLLVDYQGVEARAAVIDDDGELQTLNIETLDKKQMKGNIYLSKIIRIEPGIGAVFLDYGGKRNGFLPFSQLQRLIPKDENMKYALGKNVLVQVLKEERGTKGCSFTTEISLAGHYCVILPFENSLGGISRKVKGQIERDRLKNIVEKMNLPSYMSVLVRTSAEKKPADDIRRDIKYLYKLWNAINKKAQEQKIPSLMHEEHTVFEKAVRDMSQKEIDTILVEGKEAYKQIKQFIKNVMPTYSTKVKEYNSPQESLFNTFNVNEKIEELLNPMVSLPSGGTIIIQQTEALVSIDVNSAGYRTKSQEETNRNINLEACVEIARQVQLRDLSGIIVIDFIDMEQEENQLLISRTLKAGFKLDKARITIEAINRFGVIQMTRQRSKKHLSDYFTQKCPCCLGYGVVRTKQSMSMTILRAIAQKAFENEGGVISVTLSKEIFDYMQNNLRESLWELEHKNNVQIHLLSIWHLDISSYKIHIESPHSEVYAEVREEKVVPRRKTAQAF